MVPDLRLLELDATLVLLVDDLFELVADLVGDEVDMAASGHGGDGIDERDLLEAAVRDCEANLPAFVRIVGQDDLLRRTAVLGNVVGLYSLSVHLHVLLELIDLDALVVEIDLHTSSCASHVKDSSLD